jgi:hypothetical protein
MKTTLRLANGVRVEFDLAFRDWSSNGSSTYIGEARLIESIRHYDGDGKSHIEEHISIERQARVSFASDRPTHVIINDIEIYDPSAAFLEHFAHRHRVWDHEAEDWLTTKPTVRFELNEAEKVEIATDVTEANRAVRNAVRRGEISLEAAKKANFTPIYYWIEEEAGLFINNLEGVTAEAIDAAATERERLTV